MAAARGGEFEEFLRLLDPEVRLTVDTPDGMVVVLGATKVAAGAQLAAGAATLGRAALVNGLRGVISWCEDGSPLSVLAFTVVDGRITDITAVTDPAKLALTEAFNTVSRRGPASQRRAEPRRSCGASAVVAGCAGALTQGDAVAVRVRRFDAAPEAVILRLRLVEGHPAVAEHLEVPTQVVRLEDDGSGRGARRRRLACGGGVRPGDRKPPRRSNWSTAVVTEGERSHPASRAP